MCGIVGWYSINNNLNDKVLLKQMSDCLSHRGPDAEGFYINVNVALAHRRLSIIDLSSSANQPMTSSCGRYIIVYNGEVYNFKEIALELNVDFKTTSDTEVILEAFSKWKEAFVHKLNGMFAIAIYDNAENTLYIFRDRVGVKPIYYFYDNNDFVFASELKSIAMLKNKLNLTIDKEAINKFLLLGYIPQSNTIYNNVYKFPSGHYLKININEFAFHKYWDIKDKLLPETVNNFTEAKKELKDILIDSVRKRLVSDVPFGILLSGGIDSSVVASVAQSVSKSQLKTFSIGFNNKKHNEIPYAKKVAEHIGTEHNELFVEEKDIVDLVSSLPDIFDEPFADSSAFPTLLVFKLAKKHVTMTLSGDGGDELFLGYGAYKWANRLANPLFSTNRRLIAAVLDNFSNKYKRVANLFRYDSNTNIKSHIFSQEQYMFSELEIKNLLQDDYYCKPLAEDNYSELIRKLSADEQQSLFDFNYYLKDDLLVKVDRCSMVNSVENRVPLLDYKLVEFAYNLNKNLRCNNGDTKYLLKQVLYDYVPQELFDRPKQGFSIPLNLWLKDKLKFLLDDYLSDAIVKKHNIVKLDAVKQLKHLYLEKDYNYLYNRLWLLIVLHQFMEKHT